MNSHLVLLWVSAVASALAQSPGTFTSTGNMSTPRAGHTATLLLNGKVLIAAGSVGGFGPGPLASAELYDPSTGAFIPTGAMVTARTQHTATLLPDGKVSIAGGQTGTNGSQAIASAELYDPSTGAFTPTGAMLNLRGGGARSHATLQSRNSTILQPGGSPTPARLGQAEVRLRCWLTARS